MVEKADSDAVVVFYSWNQPGSPARLGSFTVRGVKHGWQRLPRTWPSGTHVSVTYPRSSGTTPFYLDASVGHLAAHVDVPGVPTPPIEIKKISLGCGDFQSNAIAAAVEGGNTAGRNEDKAWRSVPFGEFGVGANSNRAAAAVILNAQCDVTSITLTGLSERVVLKSRGTVDLPNNDGADRHGWARWSPSWKGQVSLPDNGGHSTYSLNVSYSDISTNSGLSGCKVTFAGKTDTLPNNGAGQISATLGPGDYVVTVDCNRPEVLTVDEAITIQMAAQLTSVPVAR